MTMNVLVTAASRHGSTAETAAAIAETLRGRGLEVALRDPADVADVARYDAVVLGSAVYMGHWLKPAVLLAERLNQQPHVPAVWLFSMGPIGNPAAPSADTIDVADVARWTRSVEHKVFTGRLSQSALSLPEKAVVRALKAPEGDFRDWTEIRRWAETIAAQLLPVGSGR
jgi:menaquinone-dependent protoporphyrinogen oxidase